MLAVKLCVTNMARVVFLRLLLFLSFPHSWNMRRARAADTGNCKNWIKRVENKWFPNVLLLLHTLYFRNVRRVSKKSKAKNCIRRSLFWERRSAGVFLHWWCFLHQDLCSTCWNFCFHPGFFSTFSGSFIRRFRSHSTCEENNAVPKGPLSGNWPQSLAIAPPTLICWL